MRLNWTKSESRDIRPFFAVESIASALDAAAIRLHDNMMYSTERAFVLGENDVRRLSISIRPALDEALVHACKSPKPEQLALAVTASNTFLKRTRVVERHSLANEVPAEIHVGSEVLEALGGPHNLEIGVCLILETELPRIPGRPFFTGHWIARTTFTLRSARLVDEFDVQPLEDSGFVARGLPPKTLYFVEYFGGINEAPQPDQQLAKVYLHADVYRRMGAEADPRRTRAMQGMLAAEIICQILAASIQEWSSVSAPVPRSPLAAFLKRINKSHNCSLQQLARMASDTGLQKLRAVLQDDQEIVRAVVEG